MRSLRDSIATVITKNKILSLRTFAAACLVAVAGIISYMGMATYVPSLVHAQQPDESIEVQNESHPLGDAVSLAGVSSNESVQSQRDESPIDEPAGVARQNEEASMREDDAANVPKPEGGTQSSAESDARQNDSRPSSVIISRFQADGCTQRGTVNLKHHQKEVRWNDYGEYAQGHKGDCVRSIQRKLNEYCTAKLDVDGQYGPRTAHAVRAYQSYMRSLGGITVNGNAIHVDGITGAQTFALMQEFATERSFLTC